MKKLISLLLVLTLALSLVGGAAISAFASGELEETAADETVVVDGEQGEPAAEADETAEETDDADAASASDELDELVAVTDDEDGIETDPEVEADEPAAAIDGAAEWKKANGFVSGQNYIIGVEGSPGQVTAISYDGSAVTGVDTSLSSPAATVIWVAEMPSGKSTVGLKNGSAYLLYGDPSLTVRTEGNAPTNWAYADGALTYAAQGGKNYAVGSGTAGSAWPCALSGTAATLAIFTDGSELGEGSSGATDPGAGGGSSSGGGSSVSFGALEPGAAVSGYVAIVVNGVTFGVDAGNLKLAAATVADGKLTVTTANFLEAKAQGDGFTLTLEDPPGETCWVYSDGTSLLNTKKGGSQPDGAWKAFPGGKLGYVLNGTTYYISGATTSGVTFSANADDAVRCDIYTGTDKPSKGGGPGGSTEKVDEDAPVISAQPTAVKYVIEDSGYAAPAYSVTATLPEGSTATEISFQWYVSGEKAGTAATVPVTDNAGVKSADSSYTASELAGKTSGVYPVYVEASVTLVSAPAGGNPAEPGNDGEGEGGSQPAAPAGETHTVKSYVVNFIVCKGVQENSILTFSDVHEVWDNIGVAVKDTIIATNGFIPALVIATGDYNNAYVAGNNEEFIEKCITTMIDRIKLQLAGIDTVWVSGNHDNGYATGFTNANQAAGLGVDADNYQDVDNGISGTGIIYDSRSDDWAANKGTSAENGGLIVIGVNYEDIGSQGAYSDKTKGSPADPSKLDYGTEGSTGTVYAHLKAALDNVAADYSGELVIISTHAGLHALGVDPDSPADSLQDGAWSGGNDYSVTNSAAVVKLINSYVDDYGLDIMFLFGHDHSKGESEFIKTPGDTIVSTVSYADRTTEEIVLKFTYAHAGYITDNIGGKEVYSYINWDDETISRYANVADGKQSTKADLTKAGDDAISRAHASVDVIDPDVIPEYVPDEYIEDYKEQVTAYLESFLEKFYAAVTPPAGASKPTVYEVEGYLPDYDYADDELIAKGITFTLPYPTGTGKNDTFIVYHMHTEYDPLSSDFTLTLLETLQGDDLFLEEDGITLTTTSLSPFVVVKVSAPSSGGGNAPGSKSGAPKTGDNTNIALWAVILTLCAGGTAAALLPRRKRNHN